MKPVPNWVQDEASAEEEDDLRAISGIYEFFPSEFSKLIASVERVMPSGDADPTTRFLFQATFALGPHKPHPF
jgi:hypothetical protein